MDHAPRTAGHSGLIERLLAGLAQQQEAYSLWVRCAVLRFVCIQAGGRAGEGGGGLGTAKLCDDSPFLPFFLPCLW